MKFRTSSFNIHISTNSGELHVIETFQYKQEMLE